MCYANGNIRLKALGIKKIKKHIYIYILCTYVIFQDTDFATALLNKLLANRSL